MFQTVVVFLIFAVAVFYIGRVLLQNFTKKDAGCASGCGKCGAIDLNKIESQLKEKGL